MSVLLNVELSRVKKLYSSSRMISCFTLEPKTHGAEDSLILAQNV
jgi:hypothetical protein